jgi:signal peptidase II
MRKALLSLLVLVLIALDQASKFWIVANIDLGQVRSFLPPLFSLTYLRNHGAAFSMLQNQQGLFAVVTVVFLLVAGYYFLKKSQSIWSDAALTLILAGGIGNFIDRLRLGYVVDMIHLDFIDFAIFNIADSYLTVGVAIMFIALWLEDDESLS